MTSKYEDFFVNCRKQKLYYQRIPKDIIVPPKSVLIFFHGFAEHCQRYDCVFDSSAKENIVSYAYDHHGHGKSDGVSGHCEVFSDFIDDAVQFVHKVVNEMKIYNDIKYFLCGTSFGGLVAVYTALRQDRPFVHGIILVAPCLGVDLTPMLRLQRAVGSILNKILPRARLVDVIQQEYLTRNHEALEDIRNDPLNNHDKARIRISLEINKAYEQLLMTIHELNVPTLLMHGTEDKITSYKASQTAFDAMEKVSDKEFKSWSHMYHDLLHEPEKEQIVQYIWEWIKKRTEVSQDKEENKTKKMEEIVPAPMDKIDSLRALTTKI